MGGLAGRLLGGWVGGGHAFMGVGREKKSIADVNNTPLKGNYTHVSPSINS